MFNFKRILAATGIAFSGLSFLSPIASALEINITYAYGTPEAHIIAAETAAAIWEDLLEDKDRSGEDVEINIHYQVEDSNKFDNDQTLGFAIPALEKNTSIRWLTSSGGYKNDLELENQNWNKDIWNNSSVGSQEFCQRNQYGGEYYTGNGCKNPNYWAYRMIEDLVKIDPSVTDYTKYYYDPIFHPNQWGDGKTYKILATTAQLKALNSWHLENNGKSYKGNLDGLIVMNKLSSSKSNQLTEVDNINPSTKLRWASWYNTNNIDPDNPFEGNNMDLTSVVLHEIGHILGFISGGDFLDTTEEARNSWVRAHQVTLLDFFRRDPQGNINLNYNSNVSTGFYVGKFRNDGSLVQPISENRTFTISNLSKGMHIDIGGDGYQNSHWDQEVTIPSWIRASQQQKEYWQDFGDDLMSPLIATNWRKRISPRDAIAFDVLGYDVNYGAIKNKSNWYYEQKGIQAANKITNSNLVNNTGSKLLKWHNRDRNEEQIVGILSAAMDAVVGQETASFWDYMDFFEELKGENLTLEDVANNGEGLGFDVRGRRMSGRSFGIHNSFQGNYGSVVKVLNQTFQVNNRNNNLREVQMSQKGSFRNTYYQPTAEELELLRQYKLEQEN